MSSGAYPQCPREDCDGNLHHEIQAGLSQSTAQMLRWGGLTLIIAPVVLAAPSLITYAARGVGTGVELAVSVALLVAGPVGGWTMLRYRSRRLAERTEQQRCNRCGSVFPD